MGGSGVSAVIFDIGNVLVHVSTTKGIMPRVVEKLGIEGGSTAERIVRSDIYSRYATGGISTREFYDEVREAEGLDLGYDEFNRIRGEIFSPVEGMGELVAEIARAGRVRLGLLSDTDEVHWGHLRRDHAVFAHFARPTLSFEIGRMKPDPECYCAAARNTGAPVGECFFVDDLERNVEGARAAGMAAVRFVGAGGVGKLREELIACRAL